MGVKDANGVAGELSQLHGARLDLVDRAARAVRSKDRGMAALDSLGQRPQAAASGSRAGSARSQITEMLDGARNQLTVEAEADQDRRLKPNVKITSGGDQASVPEAPHLLSGRRSRLGTWLH